MGRRSSNLISYIPYDDRGLLRQAGGATGALRQIQDLGIFMFISGLTEPDDDETCFVTASGAWILQSPSMDVIDAFLRPELEEMREDITTLQGGGSSSSGSTSGAVYGQAFYGFGSGTYTWTCPPGVTSVSAVCIGGGAGSASTTYTTAPGGGGLGWKNNIAVVPGTTYTVQVGRGGDYLAPENVTSAAGGDSWFISSGTVRGGGGQNGAGGGFTGDGGGNGGYSGSGAGGGAGGYTGNGGAAGASGSGGGAGGGSSYSSTYGYASGGGTGPFGQGASGIANTDAGGQGGSGGENGRGGENRWQSYGSFNLDGGLFGGGAGQGGNSSQAYGFYRGGRGCVRIIWGPGRSFPSTGTSDY